MKCKHGYPRLRVHYEQYFRVSRILQTYYKSLQVSQLTPKYEKN